MIDKIKIEKYNHIFFEDCRDTMKRDIQYDYVLVSPPDINDLNLNPESFKTNYKDFLYSIFSPLNPNKRVITIILTDRKYNGRILNKHSMVIDLMENLGYDLLSIKIWIRSVKLNLFRLTYTYILTFCKGKVKQNHFNEYEFDTWMAEQKVYCGFKYSIPENIIKKCILNFTNENDIIYNPCIGAGTTTTACMSTGRRYLGSEIDFSVYQICLHHINKYKKDNEYK
jgi:hypothetical protein